MRVKRIQVAIGGCPTAARFAYVLAAVLVSTLPACSTSLPSTQGPKHQPATDMRVSGGQAPPLFSNTKSASGLDSLDKDIATVGLADLMDYTMRHSPALDAAFYRWLAATERIPQATALPDPLLGLGIVLDQVDSNSERMGERYSISQMFPWFGKLDLRGDMALEAAQAEAQRFEAVRLALLERVTRAWFEYAWLHQAAAIAGRNRDLLQELDHVARSRYRVGAVNQADVNRVQVELGRLEEQARSLEDRQGSVAAELNAVLGRSAAAALPAAPEAPSKQIIELLPERSDEEWLALAERRNPELLAFQHELARETKSVSLARKEYYPDFVLGIEYARDGSKRMAAMDGGGSDMLVGVVSLSVPLQWGRYRAGIREAEAREYGASRELHDRELSLQVRLKESLFQHRDSARKLVLYRDALVPTARQAMATTEAAYRAGSAGFSDLVDTQRVLLELELAGERAAADLAIAGARVRALVGEGQ